MSECVTQKFMLFYIVWLRMFKHNRLCVYNHNDDGSIISIYMYMSITYTHWCIPWYCLAEDQNMWSE